MTAVFRLIRLACPTLFLFLLMGAPLSDVGAQSLTPIPQQQAPQDKLSQYEQAIWYTAYPRESREQRLARLENYVFGGSQPGDLFSREQRLDEVLGKYRQEQDVTPQPGFTTFSQGQDPVAAVPPPKPPDATDYPTVTALEREIFGRDFIRDELPQRLSRLERKVYGQVYPEMALVDRLDKLLMRVPNVRPESVSGDGVLSTLPNNASDFAGSSADVYVKLEALEQHVFSGQTYPGKLITERLDALERQVFGYVSAGSVDTRLNKLLAVRSGGNGLGTADSLQAYQPRPPVQSRPAYIPPPANGSYYTMPQQQQGQVLDLRRQNIQIGAGMSETSQMRYSPELLEMLPNDIRRQLTGSANQSGVMSGTQSSTSSTTVFGPPGTVITEEVTRYPGIQTFPNGTQVYTPPIQYRSYYSIPGGQTSGVQTVNPNTYVSPGSSMYVNPNAYQVQTLSSATVPGTITQYSVTQPNGVQVISPVYTGNPAVLQQLGELEARVFGSVNTTDTVDARLIKMETALTGQSYVGYSAEDRLANLQKVHQYQSLGKVLGNGKAGTIGRGIGSMLLGIPLNAPPGAAPTTTTPSGTGTTTGN